MASSDATPFPIKNQAYRVTFPILDADGDLVTGAAGLDSEISKDGGTFADVTAEATEIATASGMYYLDLTSTEMNADTVALIIKTTTTGAKTTPIVLYPAESTDIPVNVKAISDDTGAADNLELDYDGTGYAKANSTIGTCTTNTDMVGTDGANTTVPDAAGVAPTVGEIRTEMEGAGTKLLAIEGYTDKIDDATNGLTAIKAEVEGLAGAAMRGTDGANTTVPDAAGTAPTPAEINAEMVDVMKTDTTAEPSQGAPPATPTFEDMIAYIYFRLRNKTTTTSSEDAMWDNAGTTKLIKATISDNGTTFEKSEYVSGA